MLGWFFGTIGGGFGGMAFGMRAARRMAGDYNELLTVPFWGFVGAIIGGGAGSVYEANRRKKSIKDE